MELLSWMKRVDEDLSRTELLEIIEDMHSIINSLLVENKKYKETIMELTPVGKK
ncbi:hypothetical protein [Alkaliphilus serpentinus]|uniref:hypothetical protein n=1 Tax=Alkaliphilus serpentinus TaxID=1482731 RepID=UPI0018657D08|nr:hypothetical protein [Alkaliphilus serpentinus]